MDIICKYKLTNILRIGLSACDSWGIPTSWRNRIYEISEHHAVTTNVTIFDNLHISTHFFPFMPQNAFILLRYILWMFTLNSHTNFTVCLMMMCDFLDLKCNCFVFINHLVLLLYIEVYIILLQWRMFLSVVMPN